jgi:hypothetical protein
VERAALKSEVSFTGLRTKFRGGTVQDLALEALRIARVSGASVPLGPSPSHSPSYTTQPTWYVFCNLVVTAAGHV